MPNACKSTEFGLSFLGLAQSIRVLGSLTQGRISDEQYRRLDDGHSARLCLRAENYGSPIVVTADFRLFRQIGSSRFWGAWRRVVNHASA